MPFDRRHRLPAVLAAAVVVQLAVGVTLVNDARAGQGAGSETAQARAEATDAAVIHASIPPVPPRDATFLRPVIPVTEESQPIAVAADAPAQPPAPAPAQHLDAFAREFPHHAAARQVDGDPASFAWAVIVGVNDYAGRMDDTLGSLADATVLRDVLLAHGWRPDHVLVLGDRLGSRDGIVRALQWLARSTDERSTVVVSFSGHIRHRGGKTGLWAADNGILWSPEFGKLMGAVRAQRAWISVQGCHAEAMTAPGLTGPGRVVTFSSKAAEKSYEDPDVGHSVQGNYLFAEGFRDRWGDADHDNRVSVQEAFAWAAPRANTRTAGKQTPVLVDGLGQPFFLDLH